MHSYSVISSTFVMMHVRPIVIYRYMSALFSVVQTFANCLITEIGKQGIDYGEMGSGLNTSICTHIFL